MSTPHYRINDSHLNGEALEGYEWDILARILDTQAEGSLAALEAGVLDTDEFEDGSSYECALSGAVVTISPGHAITRHSQYGHCYIRSDSAKNPEGDIVDGEITFVYVVAVYPSAPLQPSSPEGTIGDPDLSYILSVATSVDGGVRLARIEDGVLTDDRQWSGITKLKRALDTGDSGLGVVQQAIGWPYFETDEDGNLVPRDSLDARVTALENPSGGEATEVTLAAFNALAAKVANHEARIAELEALAGLEPTEVDIPMPDDLHWAETMRAMAHEARYGSARIGTKVKAAIIIPGRTGHGEPFPDGTLARSSVVGGNINENTDIGALE